MVIETPEMPSQPVEIAIPTALIVFQLGKMAFCQNKTPFKIAAVKGWLRVLVLTDKVAPYKKSS